MPDGFHLHPEELTGTAAKIDKIVSDIKPGQLAASGGGDVFGHSGVSQAFSDFCSAAQAAAQVMVQTSQAAGENLRAAAKTYVQQDSSAGHSLSRTADPLHGGPR